jgi:hypothetical protein
MKMNFKSIFISVLAMTILLYGCATSIPISTQNGKLGHAINCTGGNMTHCYQKASELCGPKGYTILDKNDRPAGFFAGADKRLVVECKHDS